MKNKIILLCILALTAFSISAEASHRLVVNNGSGDGWYNYNVSVNISAAPPPSGKYFYRWNGTSINDRAGDRYSPNTTYSMPDRNATLTAIYRDLRRLDVTSGSGDGYYQYNQTVHISADAPPPGKIFYRWNGNNTGRLDARYSPNTTYRMPNRDSHLTAAYVDAPTSRLTVSHGSGDGDYTEDTTVTITADSPPAGKLFKEWTGSQTSRFGDRNSSTTSFTMPGSDTTITATYINIPTYTLTVSSGSGDGSYVENASVTVTADTAPAGKEFKEWTGSKVHRLSECYAASTTFSMPDVNTTITATYKNLPTLTVTHGSGDGLYRENTSVIVVADTPPTGKMFKRWDGQKVNRLGDRYSASTTFSMPAESTTLTATFKDDPDAPAEGMQEEFSVVAVGAFNGQIRSVYIENIRNRTWAQYALWSDNNRGIYFISDEKFYGAVHANSALYFWGDPEFFGKVTSASASYGGSTNDCIFHDGFEYPIAPDSLASVDFDDLKRKAALVLQGKTTIKLNGKTMTISNSRAGLNNVTTNIPHSSVIYIETATSGTSSTRPGDVNIEGELNERLTLVAERDINITDHITYTDDPKTNSASGDALGLISQRDVIIKPSCPDNIRIYAHILATGALTSSRTDGSFGVEDYNHGSKRGFINLHGGIAQDYRGAVGTFSRTGGTGTGYNKNYTYDTRFAANPPPEYPPLSNRLIQGLWRDR